VTESSQGAGESAAAVATLIISGNSYHQVNRRMNGNVVGASAGCAADHELRCDFLSIAIYIWPHGHIVVDYYASIKIDKAQGSRSPDWLRAPEPLSFQLLRLRLPECERDVRPIALKPDNGRASQSVETQKVAELCRLTRHSVNGSVPTGD
jgi:hypothetical protein